MLLKLERNRNCRCRKLSLSDEKQSDVNLQVGSVERHIRHRTSAASRNISDYADSSGGSSHMSLARPTKTFRSTMSLNVEFPTRTPGVVTRSSSAPGKRSQLRATTYSSLLRFLELGRYSLDTKSKMVLQKVTVRMMYHQEINDMLPLASQGS